MNQKIIVHPHKAHVSFIPLIKFYKLAEKVTMITEKSQLEMTDDDIKITYKYDNDQFVISEIEGRSIPQDTFYSYEDQIDIVEKLMPYCNEEEKKRKPLAT